jgi:hypothetical protein
LDSERHKTVSRQSHGAAYAVSPQSRKSQWSIRKLSLIHIEEPMAFAKSVRVEPPMPRSIVEPNRIQLVGWKIPEREYIGQRVTAFKAHQQRFIKEREDHAAAELKRMRK